MIPFKVMIVNNNPKSPNAVKMGNGVFGGRVISRDQYLIYDVEPPFPFAYKLWLVNDLQRERNHINVSSQDGGETFYCQACDERHCEHIKAVLVLLDKKRKGEKSKEELLVTGGLVTGKNHSPITSLPITLKTLETHAAKAKEFIADLQMRYAFRNTREQHLQHLRVYANRYKVDFIELAREYEKQCFCGEVEPQTGGLRADDFWTEEVKEKMATTQFYPNKCTICGKNIAHGKKRCSRCVDKMLAGWDGNTCNLPTTNANVRVPSTVIEPHPTSLTIKLSGHRMTCVVTDNDTGESLKNGLRNMELAKQWARNHYPLAKLTTETYL